jgi:hypothetical protein
MDNCKVFTRIEPFSKYETLAEILIQPDGKIVAAGSAYIYPLEGLPYFDIFLAVRYKPNGSLDTTFDGDGIVITRIGTNSALVSSGCFQ